MADVNLSCFGLLNSSNKPWGSSLASKGTTPCNFLIFVTSITSSFKDDRKNYINVVFPWTPTNKTPPIFIVASKIWVYDSGSICIGRNENENWVIM